MNALSPARIVLAGALLSAAAFFAASALPHPAAAQEVRFGGTYATANLQGVPNSTGQGIGFRWLHRGLGVGVEYDRFSGTDRFDGPACTDLGGPSELCVPDRLRFETEADFLTLLVVAELLQGESWRVRLMAGRTAGTMRGFGEGEDTGGTAEPPPADRGASLLSWSRGADGTFLAFEYLRELPVPRIPVDLRLAFRSHRLELDGCDVGRYSPFCGHVSVVEYQLGGVVAWPGARADR